MTKQWHRCFNGIQDNDLNSIVDNELDQINDLYPNAKVSVNYNNLNVGTRFGGFTGDVTIVYDIGEQERNEEEHSKNTDALRRNDIELMIPADVPFIGNFRINYDKTFTVIQFINWIRRYFSNRISSINIIDIEDDHKRRLGIYGWNDGKLQTIKMFENIEFDEVFNRTIVRMTAEIPDIDPGMDISRARIQFEVYI